MYYAKARFYDAENRRFTAVDPMKGEITNPLTMVQYIYAIDCPLIYIDVGGEKAEAVDFAGVGGSAQNSNTNPASSSNGNKSTPNTSSQASNTVEQNIAKEVANAFTQQTLRLLAEVATLYGGVGAFEIGLASGVVQAIEDFTIGNAAKLSDHIRNVSTALLGIGRPAVSVHDTYINITNQAAENLALSTGYPAAFYAGRMVADALIQSLGIAAKWLGMGTTAAGIATAMTPGAAALLGAIAGGPGGAVIGRASEAVVGMAIAIGGTAITAAGASISQAAAGRLGHDSAKYREYQDKLQCNNDQNNVNWTSHGYKHFPDKSKPWKQIVQSTKNGPAKYSPNIGDIETFERDAWATGTPTTNGKNWRVKAYDRVIGATNGMETKYVRIECSANTIHGHPISEQEYLGLIR